MFDFFFWGWPRGERKVRGYLDFEDDPEALVDWAGPFAVDVSRQSPVVSVSMYVFQRMLFSLFDVYEPHFSSSLYSLGRVSGCL